MDAADRLFRALLVAGVRTDDINRLNVSEASSIVATVAEHRPDVGAFVDRTGALTYLDLDGSCALLGYASELPKQVDGEPGGPDGQNQEDGPQESRHPIIGRDLEVHKRFREREEADQRSQDHPYQKPSSPQVERPVIGPSSNFNPDRTASYR